ncbi:MAG TPA: AAA family ATPase [Candidatus Binataceae bacterium]
MRVLRPAGSAESRERAKRFAGREHELAEIRSAIDDALAGLGRLVLFSGEPGIGKTCLADEAAALAESRGMRVQWGRCWEGGGVPAYWPWIQVLRGLLDTSDRLPTRPPELARLLQESAPETSEVTTPSSNPEQARFRLFDAVATMLKELSRLPPLMIVLDDLHESDVASMQLLRFVARELHDTHLLLVGAYRDAEMHRSPALSAVIAEILRDGHQLPISGLVHTEVAKMVETLAGQIPTATFVSDLHRATAGNPLFVDGIIRVLLAEGKLKELERLDLSTLELPENLRSAIRRRIAMLTREAHDALVVAAAIGQEFESSLLAQVTQVTNDRLLAFMREWIEAGLVTRIGQSRCRFTHPLIREALSTETADSAELHHRIAEALERIYAANLAPHLAEIAHHYRLSGDTEKAVDYSVRAGEAALKVFANHEAAALWRTALELMEQGGASAEQRAKHLHQLGLLIWGNLDVEGNRYLEKALALFEELGDLQNAAQVHIALGEHRLVEGPSSIKATMDVERAFMHYREAEKLLRGGPSLKRLIFLYAGLARASWEAARMKDAFDASHRALELAEQTGSAKGWFQAADAYCFVLTNVGRIAEARALLDRIRTRAENDGSDYASVWALNTETFHYFWGGDQFAALKCLRRLAGWRGLSDSVRHNFYVWLFHCLVLAGNLKEARTIAAKHDFPRMFTLNLAVREGLWEEAQSGFQEALDVERYSGNWDMSSLHFMLGSLNRIRGLSDEAELQLEQGIDLCGGEILHLELSLRTELVLLYADTGRPASAAPHLERSRMIVGGEDWRSQFGRLSWAEGAIAGVTGNLAEAEHQLAKAIRIFHRYHRPFEEAESRFDLGRARIESGDPKGHAEFDAAIRIYRRIGAGQAWIDRVEVERGRMGAGQADGSKVNQASPEAEFRREGEYWTISYCSETFRVQDSKAVRVIAHLLRNPGHQFHARELAALDNPPSSADNSPRALDRYEADEISGDLGDAGPGLDGRARAEYREHLSEVRSAIDEAERNNDIGRAAKLRAEADALSSEIARELGLQGRERKQSSHSERARLAITKSIHRGIDKIRELNPALGRHLANSIRTGYLCSYTPDPENQVVWRL